MVKYALQRKEVKLRSRYVHHFRIITPTNDQKPIGHFQTKVKTAFSAGTKLTLLERVFYIKEILFYDRKHVLLLEEAMQES